MANSFSPDFGPRGGSPNPGPDMGISQRGGTGAEAPMLSSNPAGSPHSSTGFRRALMKTARTGNSLKDQLPNKQTFAGKGFKKPNYFAQGGGRHGMHMGSGAPAVSPARDTGADFGGE